MKQSYKKRWLVVASAVISAGLMASMIPASPANASPTDLPFVTPGLIDVAEPNANGLPYLTYEGTEGVSAETFTIFSPEDTVDALKFNHGTALIEFKGKLYANWQASVLNEDDSDTIVRYSYSEDGQTWVAPMDLTVPLGPPSIDFPRPSVRAYNSNGGWWTDGETLVAYINAWQAINPRGGQTWARTSTDGVNWTEAVPVTDIDGNPMKGVIEQDTKALPSGRILTAFHMGDLWGENPTDSGVIVYPYYTDDPLGLTGWVKADFPNENRINRGRSDNISWELEPSWYLQEDGTIVMIFRDQGNRCGNNPRVKSMSLSANNGETWTVPECTTVPSARTKQSAGNLPDGTAYMVGDLTGANIRYPLTLVLSVDGIEFDTGYVLRDSEDLQPQRTAGQAKTRGYSYVKSLIWGDYLWAGYGTNKEDVQITRIPLSAISIRTEDLTSAMESASAMMPCSTDYTAASCEALQSAIDAGQVVLDDPVAATYAEIQAAAEAITAAVAGLALDPKIALDQTTVTIGDTVTVTGTGWTPGETVQVTIRSALDDSVILDLDTLTIGEDRALPALSFTVLDDAEPGDYRIEVVGSVSGVIEGAFTVFVEPPMVVEPPVVTAPTGGSVGPGSRAAWPLWAFLVIGAGAVTAGLARGRGRGFPV